MLIITRCVGETIVINDHIRVCIVATSPNQTAQIGIDAPREVPVMREELVYRKQKPRAH